MTPLPGRLSDLLPRKPRLQTIISDLKSKVASLQEQLQQDDRFELIDRAVNAEVRPPCEQQHQVLARATSGPGVVCALCRWPGISTALQQTIPGRLACFLSLDCLNVPDLACFPRRPSSRPRPAARRVRTRRSAACRSAWRRQGARTRVAPPRRARRRRSSRRGCGRTCAGGMRSCGVRGRSSPRRTRRWRWRRRCGRPLKILPTCPTCCWPLQSTRSFSSRPHRLEHTELQTYVTYSVLHCDTVAALHQQ